ncbi:hypothetical protein RhiirB3_447547 [Rhizophagus irregularis]|nr:hypothetical protein RhiirB3_447547 [Rhizophagus irregularis]
MSNMGDSVRTYSEEDFLQFISEEGESFLSYTTFQLGQFVENGFLKTLFDKNPQQPVDKAQLLVDMFGESSNPNNFAQQAAAMNIQPTTLSLLFSIALYASSKFICYTPILPDVEMTPVDQTVTPETFWKKDKQKARVTDDKQADRKPQSFLMTCGASAFKIIKTSKGKRKLVGYFENWEATLKALGILQAFRENSQEL